MHFKLIFVEGDCDLAFVTTLFDLKPSNFLEITQIISKDPNGKLIKEIIERYFSISRKRNKVISIKDDTIYYIWTFSEAESYKYLMTGTLNSLINTFLTRYEKLLNMIDIIVITDCDAETIQQCDKKIKICSRNDPVSKEKCEIFYVKCYLKNENNYPIHLLLVIPNMEKLLKYEHIKKEKSKKDVCKELTYRDRERLYHTYEECVNNNLIL